MSIDIGIVLTGTIIPNSNYVVHVDTEKRRLEYLNAIDYYKTFAPVFFLENSKYPLLSDSDFVNKDNVFLRHFSPSKYFHRGKGYQEFEMIEKWLENESNLPKRFIKITGRYIITNFQCIFNECINQKANHFLIDQLKQYKVALTRLFYIDSDYYRKAISGLYVEGDDEKDEWIERVFYRKLTHLTICSQIFINEPNFIGKSGSTGSNIKVSYVKNLINFIMRKINYLFNKKYIYYHI